MGFEYFSRLLSLVCSFFVLMVLELFFQRRVLLDSKNRRWAENLGLLFTNSAIVFILASLIPFVPASVGLAVQNYNLGFMTVLRLAYPLKLVLSVALLDLVMYLQHLLFHTAPHLWRLHLVHHSDLDMDLTTGVRYHPLETVMTLFIKASAVYLFGIPFMGVVAFEVCFQFLTLFNHSNIFLPQPLDRLVRFILVTPDMHRVHHSVERVETNSNFGFCFSFWDRLAGTYRRDGKKGQLKIVQGLSHIRKPRRLNFLFLFVMPIIEKTGPYPLNVETDKVGPKKKKSSTV